MGLDRKRGDAHRRTFQLSYDDPSRGLRRIKLDLIQARANYICRHCGGYLGCASCIEDVAGLVCSTCRDWGNLISEKVHGAMVKSLEARSQAMKIVLQIYNGEVAVEDFEKVFQELT